MGKGDEKPSNKVFMLSRTRFDNRWEDLSDREKITVLLDLIDDLWGA